VETAGVHDYGLLSLYRSSITEADLMHILDMHLVNLEVVSEVFVHVVKAKKPDEGLVLLGVPIIFMLRMFSM